MLTPHTSTTALWMLLGIVAGTASAHASAPAPDDDDTAALALPVEQPPAHSAPERLFAAMEIAQIVSTLDQGGDVDAQRASFDLRADESLAPGWRAQAADHLDLLWPGTFAGSQQINTLKEAYLSWQAQSDLLLDAGRVNVRQGVGYAYNPTDFLRTGALRTEDSIDPNALRMTRLGTVMLRSQWLWDSGSLTTLYAPRLADHPTTAPWDPDFGAANSSNRWMVSLSQRLIGTWTPQWLVFDTGRGQPQFGVNTTAAVGQSSIAYLELTAGNNRTQWQQALRSSASASWHSRLATGATYSFLSKLSVTLELEYDGGALTRRQWSAARAGNPLQYLRYVQYVFEQQELATQFNSLAAASWQDLMIQHLDLSAFVRRDLIDGSSLIYTELRYHWSHVDAAIRWQDYRGGATTDYGLSPIRQSWQLLLDYYL